MNRVILSGRITADIETRYTLSGSAVAQFNIATNRKWIDQSGELKEEVSFFGIVAFGKQAETVAQYFRKGSPILIDGRLKQESWEDKQTQQKRSKTVVIMENFEFMEGKRDGQDTKPASRPTSEQAVKQDDDGDSVPF